MTKISIHGEIEFVPDEPEVREARLLDLIEDHMGRDMRYVLEAYVMSDHDHEELLARIDTLETENYALNERLDEANNTIEWLRDTGAGPMCGR